MGENRYRCHKPNCDGILKPDVVIGTGEVKELPIYGKCDKCGALHQKSKVTKDFYLVGYCEDQGSSNPSFSM